MSQLSGGRIADQHGENKQKLDKTRNHEPGNIIDNTEKNKDYAEQEASKGGGTGTMQRVRAEERMRELRGEERTGGVYEKKQTEKIRERLTVVREYSKVIYTNMFHNIGILSC